MANGNGQQPQSHMQLLGLGTVVAGVPGAFTLTVAIDRFVQIRDVMLADDAGIVTDITAVSVDGMDLYLGPGTLLPQSILATNLARSRFPLPGVIRRQVTITFNVSAAGTVGFNALAVVYN